MPAPPSKRAVNRSRIPPPRRNERSNGSISPLTRPRRAVNRSPELALRRVRTVNRSRPTAQTIGSRTSLSVRVPLYPQCSSSSAPLCRRPRESPHAHCVHEMLDVPLQGRLKHRFHGMSLEPRSRLIADRRAFTASFRCDVPGCGSRQTPNGARTYLDAISCTRAAASAYSVSASSSGSSPALSSCTMAVSRAANASRRSTRLISSECARRCSTC